MTAMDQARRAREEAERLEAHLERVNRVIALCQVAMTLCLCWLAYSCEPRVPETVNVQALRIEAKYRNR